MDWFVGHMVGDFIFQQDWMAAKKKKENIICLIHVVCYIIAIFIFTQWPWWALLITAICHFAQDRTNFISWWMGFNRQKDFRDGPLKPWSSIVVDNTFHFIQLYLTNLLVLKFHH